MWVYNSGTTACIFESCARAGNDFWWACCRTCDEVACAGHAIAAVVRGQCRLSTISTSFVQSKDSFEYYASEHFRMSGIYWGLTALHLLNREEELPTEPLLAWVMSCQRSSGGFGGSERHDAHLLYTLSALQILALARRLDDVDADKVAECAWGEDRVGAGEAQVTMLTCVCIACFLLQTLLDCSSQTAPLLGTSGARSIPGARLWLTQRCTREKELQQP